jgi:hypothetical protein
VDRPSEEVTPVSIDEVLRAMDEKLKNQLLISVIAGGAIFMIWMFYTFFAGSGSGLFFNYFIAFVLGAVVGGATFGILYFVQKE